MATARDEFNAFQKRYPTKAGKIRALNGMTDKQIDRLISGCPNKTGKTFYTGFKSNGIRRVRKRK